jgi:hypothetical protein
VASNTVGITASTAAADANATGSQAQPGSTVQPGTPQGQGDDGFFGSPNDQPGFFGGFGDGDGSRHHRSSGGFDLGAGSGSSGGPSGQSGQGGSNGSTGGGFGSFGSGTSQSGGFGPMMQSGGS